MRIDGFVVLEIFILDYFCFQIIRMISELSRIIF